MEASIDISKLEKYLNKLQEELKEIEGVKVGWTHGGANYPDGTPLEKIALIHEYGATIEIPARTQTVYRSLNERTGEFNKHGRFVKKKESNFEQEVDIPTHKINIPARAPVRKTINLNKEKWVKDFEFIASNSNSLKTILRRVGWVIKTDLQNMINSNLPPPNKPSTIRQKGSSKTLIDTGFMRNHVQVQVVEKLK